jgi:hypothetical protein
VSGPELGEVRVGSVTAGQLVRPPAASAAVNRQVALDAEDERPAVGSLGEAPCSLGLRGRQRRSPGRGTLLRQPDDDIGTSPHLSDEI